MKKRIILILLIAVFAAASTGCSGNNNQPGTSATNVLPSITENPVISTAPTANSLAPVPSAGISPQVTVVPSGYGTAGPLVTK